MSSSFPQFAQYIFCFGLDISLLDKH
jgi:hypothetical protein